MAQNPGTMMGKTKERKDIKQIKWKGKANNADTTDGLKRVRYQTLIKALFLKDDKGKPSSEKLGKLSKI